MNNQLIDLLTEQLRNEFPESDKDMKKIAVRMSRLIKMEFVSEIVSEARGVIKQTVGDAIKKSLSSHSFIFEIKNVKTDL